MKSSLNFCLRATVIMMEGIIWRRNSTLFNASAADTFLKLCEQKKKLQNVKKNSIGDIFSSLFNHYTFNDNNLTFFLPRCVQKLPAADESECGKVSRNISVSMKVNPFPHTDTFWRLCSRRLFENIMSNFYFCHNTFKSIQQLFFQL